MKYYVCEMKPASRQVAEWENPEGGEPFRIESTSIIGIVLIFEKPTFEQAQAYIERVRYQTDDYDIAIACVENVIKDKQ